MSGRRAWVGMMLLAGFYAVTAPDQSPLQGCAPVPRPGQWVDIRDESALIVWDSKSGTEHFVRRAQFETQADDFGFMVPTPSRPDLGEVDDRVFETAGMLTAPRHFYQTTTKSEFGFGNWTDVMFSMAVTSMPAPNAMPQGVAVLEEKQVAGFDATVLQADDTQALADWLDKHGYESRPALTEWLKWYVDHKWIITAFKLSRSAQGDRDHLNTKSIRMSFQTDKPFYPYREPEDMRRPSGQGSRTLRVFVLSDQKYEGTLGESEAWPANTMWANDVSSMAGNITSRLKLSDPELASSVQGARYLTEFEDRSFPRPGTDEIYFRSAADQSSKERLPIGHTSVVIEYWPGPRGAVMLIALAIVSAVCFAAFLVRRTMTRRVQAPASA